MDHVYLTGFPDSHGQVKVDEIKLKRGKKFLTYFSIIGSDDGPSLCHTMSVL